MTEELKGQLPLFDTEPLTRKAPKVTDITWSKYNPTRNPCDLCVATRINPHTNGRVYKAHWKRTTKDGSTLLLCSAHAQDFHTREAMAALKKENTP